MRVCRLRCVVKDGRPYGLSSGHRGPGQTSRGCLGDGTAAIQPDAQVLGDSGQAHGRIEMQVRYPNELHNAPRAEQYDLSIAPHWYLSFGPAA